MALVKLKGELPKDAVFLTESEAIKHQWKLVWNWEPQSEILPLRYGYAVAGFCSGITSFYFNQHYRSKLKLRNYGKISSYLPTVMLSTILGSFTHLEFVTNDILLHRTECPLCVEMRAVALQSAFGLVYPMILSPLSGFVNANNYLTYDVPSLRSPSKVLKLFWKFTKPITMNLSIILAFQAISASLLTYQEVKALHKIESEIVEKEAEDS